MHPVAIRDFGADRVVTPPGYRPVRYHGILFVGEGLDPPLQLLLLTRELGRVKTLPYSYHSFTEIKGYPLQNRKIYDNMFLYVLIYCYGDFHAEKISDCISGIHGTFD